MTRRQAERAPRSSLTYLPPLSHGSLVVSFNKQRIATASPKNFILTRQAYIATNTNTDMMMQFGKRRRGVYAMDFKGPVNPLQAFALSLVAFHFRRDEPRPEPA